MRKKPTKQSGDSAVVLQRMVGLLAAKWVREGRDLIARAEEEPDAIGDAVLRNSGAARLKCAKELRAQMRKQSNND